MSVRPQDIRWRLAAFFSGVALELATLFPLQSFLGDESRLTMPIVVASYFIVAMILGYCFHDKSWRVGSWLIAFFLLLLVGSVVFVGSRVPWHWNKEARGLMEAAMIVTAAFIGVAVGSFVKRRVARTSLTLH